MLLDYTRLLNTRYCTSQLANAWPSLTNMPYCMGQLHTSMAERRANGMQVSL